MMGGGVSGACRGSPVSKCNEPHGSEPGVSCQASQSPHDMHAATNYATGDYYEWPNEDFVRVAAPSKRLERSVASKVAAFASDMRERRARARYSDPETSWDAAKALGDLTEAQLDVLTIIVEGGEMTDYEIRQRALDRGMRQSPSGLRSRRDELVKVGLVEWTGSTRPKPDTGHQSRVWRAVSIA